MANDVTVDLGNAYIGSAYSPVVDITETADGHTVSITSADPDNPGQLVTHTYDVPDWSDDEAGRAAAEQARQAAETARIAAEQARAEAETARADAETERQQAEQARYNAEQGRINAEQARRTAAVKFNDDEWARKQAEQAREEAEAARQQDTAAAISDAQAATSAANTAATTATGAASAANSAASAATTATGQAQTATTAANDAAAAATTAAGSANTAAGTANTAATAADEAREGIQGDLDAIRDELDNKADSDGYYTMLTAGAADNLTARGDGVTASFLHRTTGGSASVPDDAEATVRSIKGRTLAWNQLYDKSTVETTTSNGITFTVSADGSITASGTATAMAVMTRYGIPVVAGHKYLLKGCPSGGSGRTYYSYLAGAGFPYSGHFDTGAGDINVPSTTGTASYVLARVESGQTVDNIKFHPQLFDLTAMFGAGNEPSTVEEFEALYPEPYYEYDAGSLLPVRMTGVETTGYNAYDGTTGTAKLLGGHQYQITGTYTSLSFETVGGETEVPALTADGIFQTSANGTLTVTGGGSDTCLHLVWSGYRNGEYEPYWSEQRVIAAIAENFPDGMRGVGTGANMVCDELTNHEAIHRVYEVVLDGSQTGVRYVVDPAGGASGNMTIVTVTHAGWVAAGLPVPMNRFGTVKCDRLPTEPTYHRTWTGKCISGYTDSSAAFIIAPTGDNSITTEAEFVAWLRQNPLTIHYALATPTTTPFATPLNLTYRFADFGTERILVPEGEMSAPPTMDVVYGLNAPDTLRTLPTEYVSKASDASFTAALGSFLNATITRTWNETAGRYDYTITANGE